MRKRLIKKLSKDYGTFEKIDGKLKPRLFKDYKKQMKINRRLRTDIRRLVTQALMGETLEGQPNEHD